KWTDPSVTTALKSMGKILGDTSNIAGGTAGALQDSFNQSVTNAFSSPAKAAMVFEADFVGGVILSQTKAKPKTGFNTFVWPQITAGADAKAVEIAGDLMVTFRDNPAIEAFVKFLATPKAAAIWAKQGGFGTGNHNMSASVYPDSITRATEAPVVAAPPPGAEPGRLGRYLIAAVFLAPALVMLGVWMVYPAVYTIVRSFFGQTGFLGSWVGIDNYKTLFTSSYFVTAIKN